MIEGLIALCLNKPLKILWNIEYKEFENYLRDENHLPALPQDNAYIESFFGVREEILVESLKQVITRRPELNFPHDLPNFVSLNRWGQSICRFLGHELILFDESVLTYKVNPLGMRERDIDLLLKPSSQIRTNWPMLKVVAVS
jgi:transposase InsO family protein